LTVSSTQSAGVPTQVSFISSVLRLLSAWIPGGLVPPLPVWLAKSWSFFSSSFVL